MGKSSQYGFGTNAGVVPSVDAVSEIKVVTGAADASTGHGAGSSIDVQYKSGSNQLHGTLDYYKRGSWLDTYAWSTKFNALTNNQVPTKAPHNRNQFSLEFDGPVVIPHLFQGKNKLFFTASYEEMLEKLPNTGYSYFNIPNPTWVTGDFSSAQYYTTINGASGLQPDNIYDPLTPLTMVVDPNDGFTKSAHSQFAGNVIPSNRIDPVGQAIMTLMASVKPNNNPGAGYAPYTNNWANLQIENDTWRNGLFKVDYVLSDSDRISAHWNGQGRWASSNSVTGWPDSEPFNMNGKGKQPLAETGGLEWTHTFNPNLLFDFHASLMNQENDNKQGPDTGNELQKLGFASAFYNQVQNKNHFPYVGIVNGVPNGGWTPMAWFITGGSWHLHVLDFLPTLTWIHGQHTVRAGLDIQLHEGSNPFGGTNDQFNFDNGWTQHYHNYSEAPGYSSGGGWASLLLGYPANANITYDIHTFEWAPYYAPWIQDDWKLTKNLTLNLGFRWDFQVPRVERHNKVDGIFNTGVVENANGIAIAGGPEFAGVNGQRRGPFGLNWFEVQPRIGFAYAFRPNISLRGFVAKNYQLDSSINGNTGFGQSTSYIASTDGVTPYTATHGGLANPIATVLQPVGSSLGHYTNMGNGWGFYNPQYHIPSFWNYSMTLEAAVTKHDTVNVGYVGNITPDGPVADNINHPSAAFYQQCNGEVVGWASDPHQICDNNSASNTVGFMPNPFQGNSDFAGSGYFSNDRISRADATRPFFGWSDINENGATNDAKSWYNAFQAGAKHQVSNSLSLFINYTHATATSEGNWLDTTYRIKQGHQVSTTNQVKHAINFSGVTYLPFGRGRALLSHANRFVDEIVNGWEISPLLSWYSGFVWRPGGIWEINTSAPMGVSHTTLPADGAHNYKRIRGVTPCVGHINSDTGAVIPSPAATEAGCTSIPYVQAGAYAVPRNVIDFGVTQPGALHFDLAGAKNFSVPYADKIGLGENTKLQLRVDMLNVLNHANWDYGYDGNPGDLNWGTIGVNGGGPTNPQRLLQLSARLTF